MQVPNINAHLLLSVLGWIVSQAVAFGVLNTGAAQTVVAVGGIVIPAAIAIAAALHLGRVHAAQLTAVQAAASARPAASRSGAKGSK